MKNNKVWGGLETEPVTVHLSGTCPGCGGNVVADVTQELPIGSTGQVLAEAVCFGCGSDAWISGQH